MNPTLRRPIQAQVKRKTALALNQWYQSVYHSIRFVQKQEPVIDWEAEKKKFEDELLAIMAWASSEYSRIEEDFWAQRGKIISPDAQRILDQYEIDAGKRLARIGDTTERNTKSAVENWDGTDRNDLIAGVNRWYGEDRAANIAKMETGFLLTAGALITMMAIDTHQWIWRHGEECDTGPCELICAPNEGEVFSYDVPMPPMSTHYGCDCYGEPYDPSMVFVPGGAVDAINAPAEHEVNMDPPGLGTPEHHLWTKQVVPGGLRRSRTENTRRRR